MEDREAERSASWEIPGYIAFSLVFFGLMIFFGSAALFVIYVPWPWTITTTAPGLIGGYLIGRGVTIYEKIYRKRKIAKLKDEIDQLDD